MVKFLFVVLFSAHAANWERGSGGESFISVGALCVSSAGYPGLSATLLSVYPRCSSLEVHALPDMKAQVENKAKQLVP